MYTTSKSICFLTLLAILFLVQGQLFAAEEITVIGLIEENELDENGNTISVTITFLDDNSEYVTYNIFNSELSIPILSLIGETIEVTGVLSTDNDANKIFTVSSFSTIDDFEYDIPEESDMQQDEE